MRYVTSFERLAMKRGIEQGRQELRAVKQAREDVLDVLASRFKSVPIALVKTITRMEELPILKEWLKQAAIAKSVQEFQEALQGIIEHSEHQS